VGHHEVRLHSYGSVVFGIMAFGSPSAIHGATLRALKRKRPIAVDIRHFDQVRLVVLDVLSGIKLKEFGAKETGPQLRSPTKQSHRLVILSDSRA
jgi:hypothetical protein